MILWSDEDEEYRRRAVERERLILKEVARFALVCLIMLIPFFLYGVLS